MLEPRWKHQEEDLAASWMLRSAAIHHDPRLGKTRLAIETASMLRAAGSIDAAVVLAPNGVHLEWSRLQIPKYWPGYPDGGAPIAVHEWISDRANTVRGAAALEALLDTRDFVWFVANMEATSNGSAKKPGKLEGYLRRFLERRRGRALLVLDEAHWIKDPKAARTRAIFRLGDRAVYRRALTGTPMANSPFDLWAQYYFLDPTMLGPLFTPFKARYGVFKRGGAPKRCRWCDWPGDHKIKNWKQQILTCSSCGRDFKSFGPLYQELVEYRNLDELRARVAPITFVRKKADCLDLPERVTARRLFVVPPAHRRVYEELKGDLIARLDSGEEVTAASALTMLLRLSQVARGHVRPDGAAPADVRELGEPYPAVGAAVDLVREHDGKSIVWCRFRADVAQVCAALAAHGIPFVQCHGGTPVDLRPGLRARFNDAGDESRVWVGTLATGGTGVDLGIASLMVFYSHGYNLVERLQGLERNYGSSQKASRVEIVDIVAADTVDERALSAIERKEDLAAVLDGSRLRAMLSRYATAEKP